MNKSYGLMFKPDMILAYLRGEKNQTRRITKGLAKINENPDDWEITQIRDGSAVFLSSVTPIDSVVRNLLIGGRNTKVVRLPYGNPGDTLYFKETWRMWERDDDGKDFLHYRADDAKVDPTWWTEDDWKKPDPVWLGRFDKWQSSMFMPRICSRFRDVPILNVRVERLLDITDEDAWNEGCPRDVATLPRLWYYDLWNEINGKTMPASRNPWLFVYEFKRHDG